VATPRRLYLVILTLLVLAMAAAGVYLRQRAIRTAAAVADCETPALPPPPTTPPPKLPGFTLEAGCGAAPAAAKPAPPKAPK
jgi:hypothetical protein